MTGAEKAFVGTREPTPQPEPLLGRRWEDIDPERKWILLASDHVVFRQALALVLEQHADFKSVQAGSLAEALHMLGGPQGEPDLAILDLELRTGEGVALVEELRRAKPGVPVLALTVRQDPKRVARALEAGASEVLATVATAEDLFATVRRLVGG